MENRNKPESKCRNWGMKKVKKLYVVDELRDKEIKSLQEVKGFGG